ncbi:RNA repair domain-containing protein [Rhizohabitans arisaemae]|uniref:RNA repair domain-containing protein n=1 Tax=Rhizohabitans arisaemae TaxID=2720610 RepID=UPI0024B12201|nr:RNA repair domain-containing protein [Rhizohabitans arisaemae]
MRTSDEIYHRIRWDPRFDPERFVLGINVRGAAPERMPLLSFVPGGDIPWHRILFIEADGELVWDRETGLDRVDSARAGRVPEPRGLRTPAEAAPAGRSYGRTARTARTAVAWVPPRDLWPPIQEIRREHDPRFLRWPPHVTFLFAFVPETEFEDAEPLLAAAAAEIAPFTARLYGVRTFRHRSAVTVWLDPAAAGAEPWIGLHGALERRFPRRKARTGPFIPHLTLGRTRDPDRLADVCRARLGDMSVRVGEVHLLSRQGAEPMRPRVAFALGTGEPRRLD